jgi:hypothetical protein
VSQIRINITLKRDNEIPSPSTTVTPGTIPYVVKEDREIFVGIRSCAPCPAVIILKSDPHNFITEQWQYYIRAINYNQPLQYVVANFGYFLAYCNGTGFGNPSDPRANFLTRQRLDQKLPQFDKVRTNTRSVLTGTEQYSLMTALKSTQSRLQSILSGKKLILREIVNSLVSKNVLKVQTFDITKPPPLKQGRSYPTRVEDVDPTAYLYMPQYNREMFLVANIVKPDGKVVQFDNGGLYDWTGDNTPYTFLPHVSNPNYGDVLAPLEWFTKLTMDAPVPSPYRR